MCQHHSRESDICFIIPPHIQEHLATHARSAAAQQRAMRQLAIAAQVRGRRSAFLGGTMAPGGAATVGAAGKERLICDAENAHELPGRLVRRESNGPTDDIPVDEAYDGSGHTYDFFFDVFGRDSIDGQGMNLLSTVHYGQDYGNAFWEGSQMVYGDGDGEFFGSMTCCLDIIAHELTHGVTQFAAGLVYRGQPGALNESFSDVFGCLVKQYVLDQTVEQADWLVGAELLIPREGSIRHALRSLKAPGTAYDDPELGKDPQPYHMRDYFTGPEDNQGVHINSGIPNHAFYLAAMAMGGRAWQTVGPVWYETLTTRLRPLSGFAEAAMATVDVASRKDDALRDAIANAWREVGVL